MATYTTTCACCGGGPGACCHCSSCEGASGVGQTPQQLLITLAGLTDGTNYPCSLINGNYLATCLGTDCAWTAPLVTFSFPAGTATVTVSATVLGGILHVTLDINVAGCRTTLTWSQTWDCGGTTTLLSNVLTGPNCCATWSGVAGPNVIVSPVFTVLCRVLPPPTCACCSNSPACTLPRAVDIDVGNIFNGDCDGCPSANGTERLYWSSQNGGYVYEALQYCGTTVPLQFVKFFNTLRCVSTVGGGFDLGVPGCGLPGAVFWKLDLLAQLSIVGNPGSGNTCFSHASYQNCSGVDGTWLCAGPPNPPLPTNMLMYFQQGFFGGPSGVCVGNTVPPASHCCGCAVSGSGLWAVPNVLTVVPVIP